MTVAMENYMNGASDIRLLIKEEAKKQSQQIKEAEKIMEKKIKDQEESVKRQIEALDGRPLSEPLPRQDRASNLSGNQMKEEEEELEPFIDQKGDNKKSIFWRKNKGGKTIWQTRKGWSAVHMKNKGIAITDHTGETLILIEDEK